MFRFLMTHKYKFMIAFLFACTQLTVFAQQELPYKNKQQKYLDRLNSNRYELLRNLQSNHKRAISKPFKKLYIDSIFLRSDYSSAFYTVRKQYYKYDSIGRVSSIKSTDNSQEGWENSFFEEFNYNLDNNPTFYRTFFWNSTRSDWDLVLVNAYKYRPDRKLDTIYFYQLGTSGMGLFGVNTYEYLNNDSTISTSFFTMINDSMKIYNKLTKFYSQNLDSIYSYSYINDTPIREQRSHFNYLVSGAIESIITDSIHNIQVYPYLKENYIYNSRQDLDTIKLYTWDKEYLLHELFNYDINIDGYFSYGNSLLKVGDNWLPTTDAFTYTNPDSYCIMNFAKEITIYYSDAMEIPFTDNKKPISYSLNQNYPNPFNPNTNITFTLSETSQVELNVYNTLGEKVAELLNTEKPAGSHTVSWNATNYPSGVYLYELKTPTSRQIKKMILAK